MTATLVWSYERDGHYALSQGSAQRLANGNTFIGWGSVKSTLATEVDAEGRIVFDMAASDFISYRAWRFAD